MREGDSKSIRNEREERPNLPRNVNCQKGDRSQKIALTLSSLKYAVGFQGGGSQLSDGLPFKH